MSDNKKYYYLKFKDNYFEQDNIRILESMPNGHIYSLIIIKLYLKAVKYGGQLRMTEAIPYDPEKMNILASVIIHDVAHVKEALRLGMDLGLISVIDSGEIWMTEIQNMIGQSSTEGDRKRVYRAKLKLTNGTECGQMSDSRPPEKEKEKEIKKEINIGCSFCIWNKYPNKQGKVSAFKKIPKLIKKYKTTEVLTAIDRYIDYVDHQRKNGFESLAFKNGSTFFNSGIFDFLGDDYESPKVEEKKAEKRAYTNTDKYNFREQSKKDPSFKKIEGVDIMAQIKKNKEML